MDLDVRLSINGVREPGELRDPAKVRNEVFRNLASASRTVDVFRVLLRTLSLADHGERADLLTSITSSAAFFEN